MSKITLNIVEPGSSTPIAPNTGLFMNGIGTPEATAIISAVIILGIIATYIYKKYKKAGKTSKLAYIIERIKTARSNKKRVVTGTAVISLLVLGCTFTAFLLKASATNADGNLTVNVSDEEYTIEVADEPVFAVFPVEVTVEEATEIGYTLTAYTDSTDFVSTTNPDNVIPMITLGDNEIAALSDNTWGLALEGEPTSKDDTLYTILSTDQNNPTILKTTDNYTATEANDTTTIYYGFYITPDIPYGIYTGGEVEYQAKENSAAKVIFDGNGLYFNNDSSQTKNIVYYNPGSHSEYRYSHTPNVSDDGQRNSEYGINLAKTTVYDFSDYEQIYLNIVKSQEDVCWGSYNDFFAMWTGNHPEYTAENNWDDEDSITEYAVNKKYPFAKRYKNKTINISDNIITIAYYTDSQEPACGMDAYGYYVKMIGYTPNIIASGEYLFPDYEKSFRLLGWSEDKNATIPTYTNEEAIERELSLSMNETVTLYAVWEPAVALYYNGNGADGTTDMNRVVQYTANLNGDSQVDLLASNFKKAGYGFVGWSTDSDAWDKLTDNDTSNDSAIYGPNQMITIDNDLIAKAGENRKLTLYAVWAPAEKDSQGNPVYLQNWTGCSNLSMATYNSTTNDFTVGNNTITALTDSRDGNIYTIARLADGNCWMTENLRIADTHVNANGETETTILTPQDTNKPHTENGVVALINNNGTINNHLSPSSDDWCFEYEAQCYDQAYLNTRNTTDTTVSPSFSQDFTDNPHDNELSNLSDNIYSYGNYYNLYSATAGTATSDSWSGIADGDICPSGWNLPIAGYDRELNGSLPHLGYLIGSSQQGSGVDASNAWRSFPNNFIYSGVGYNSNRWGRGKQGYYITSTIGGNSINALSLEIQYVYPGNSGTTSYTPASVRCILTQ